MIRLLPFCILFFIFCHSVLAFVISFLFLFAPLAGTPLCLYAPLEAIVFVFIFVILF